MATDPYFDPGAPGSESAPDAIAYVDGAVEPVNPGGTGGWGFTIRDHAGVLLKEGYGRMAAKPEMTNNVAEYIAAGLALKAYQELGRPGPLLVRGDSKLVVMQMLGHWKPRGGSYVKVYYRVKALLEKCSFVVQWEWVPREQNQRADALSKLALMEIGIAPRGHRG